MGFTFTGGKSKSSSTNGGGGASENWGMGLLLVFFPDDTHDSISDQNKLFPSSSSIKRSNYSNLLTKAQSTISLCLLLVFISLLLFTLSTFDPTLKPNLSPPRRFLSQKPASIPSNWFSKKNSVSSIALQGMGTLYMRGTKSMNDLVVFHVGEDLEEHELRFFLRLLHRSGLTSKSDSVFLFPSQVFSSRFASVIREENDSFLKLLHRFKSSNTSGSGSGSGSGLRFDGAKFMKKGNKEKGLMEEPIWGKRLVKKNSANDSVHEEDEFIYGSVLGFEASETDPENSLSGFLDYVPMSLRRWACYPMLLGRVRRNFKHVMLVDLKTLIFLGDPIGKIRAKSSESVLLFTKHGRKNSEKPNSPHHHLVNPAIIIGGARGVRRLSNAVVVEIARALMQHKKKNSVSEAGILSRLVDNEFILKNVKVVTTTEAIPELGSAMGSLLTAAEKTAVIQRGNNVNYREISSVIMKEICVLENLDSFVYSDCQQS